MVYSILTVLRRAWLRNGKGVGCIINTHGEQQITYLFDTFGFVRYPRSLLYYDPGMIRLILALRFPVRLSVYRYYYR
jgi:hypothetical protein